MTPFDSWWKTYIKIPKPSKWSKLIWSHGAIFSVSRNRIKQYDKCFYQHLLSTIDDHVNPEEGHYFERIWFSLFNKMT